MLTDAESRVTLNVRVAPNRATWASDTSFFFRASETRFLVDGTLDVRSQLATSQRLDVPRPLRIDQVTATTGGQAHDVRWHTDHEGNLKLFFRDRASGRIQVRIEGHLISPSSTGDIELPLITPHDAQFQSATIQLYRSPAKDVQPIRSDGLIRIADENTYQDMAGAIPTEDRLVGSWVPAAASGDNLRPMAVRVATVQRTNVRVTGTMTTRVDRDAYGWTATVHAALEAQSGRIDVVRFEIPASLESEDISAGARLEVLSGPTIDKRLLVAWLPPSEARQRTLDFKLRIAVPVQEDVSLPQIRMLDVKLLHHDIFLATQVAGDDTTSGSPDDKLSWVSSGLDPLESQRSGYESFRVAQSDYQAKLRPPAVDRKPQVHLLHTMLAWTTTRQFVGLATFDLRPAGLSTCILELPPECRLVQVLVDGNRTGAEPRKRVHLANPTWSKSVAAACSSHVPWRL